MPILFPNYKEVFIKYSVFSLVFVFVATTVTIAVGAQTIEFAQLNGANLGAPLPVASFNNVYAPFSHPYVFHALVKPWGYGYFSGTIVPSIAFGTDDNMGIAPDEMCGTNFPKHIGTDYTGGVGTPVYAIADGNIKRAGIFTNAGDYYVVVESGNAQKWTTLYGHLKQPQSYISRGGTKNFELSIPIKKGALIGTLFNYLAYDHYPHLHMGIRKGPYMNVAYNDKNASTRGFACATDPEYQTNEYNFVSPEQFNYFTHYY